MDCKNTLIIKMKKSGKPVFMLTAEIRQLSSVHGIYKEIAIISEVLYVI